MAVPTRKLLVFAAIALLVVASGAGALAKKKKGKKASEEITHKVGGTEGTLLLGGNWVSEGLCAQISTRNIRCSALAPTTLPDPSPASIRNRCSLTSRSMASLPASIRMHGGWHMQQHQQATWDTVCGFRRTAAGNSQPA